MKHYSDTTIFTTLEDDQKQLDEYIHKIKGVSGNLNIHKVFEVSSVIHDQHKFELLPELIETMNIAVEEIQTKLLPLKISADLLSKDELLLLIGELKQKAQDFEYIDSKKSSLLLDQLQVILDKEFFDRVSQGFSMIDYDTLVVVLDEVIEYIDQKEKI